MRTADLQVNKGNSAVKCSQNYDKTDSALRFGIVMIFVRCLPTGLQAIGNIGCKILGGTLWSVGKWRMSFQAELTDSDLSLQAQYFCPVWVSYNMSKYREHTGQSLGLDIC